MRQSHPCQLAEAVRRLLSRLRQPMGIHVGEGARHLTADVLKPVTTSTPMAIHLRGAHMPQVMEAVVERLVDGTLEGSSVQLLAGLAKPLLTLSGVRRVPAGTRRPDVRRGRHGQRTFDHLDPSAGGCGHA